MQIYDTYRKIAFPMKITATFLMLLVLFLPACGKQGPLVTSTRDGAYPKVPLHVSAKAV